MSRLGHAYATQLSSLVVPVQVGNKSESHGSFVDQFLKTHQTNVSALSEKQTRRTGKIYISAEQVQKLVAMSCTRLAGISYRAEAALRSQNKNHRNRNVRTE